MSTLFEDRRRLHGSRSTQRETALDRVRAALASLPESNLHALRSVALEPTDIAPELMFWIEHAIAWELDRRSERCYVLHEPLLAIDSTKISSCILALAALSRRFSGDHPDVDTFFIAIIGSLDLRHVLH